MRSTPVRMSPASWLALTAAIGLALTSTSLSTSAQNRGDAGRRTRVLIQIQLPDNHRPEGQLGSAAAVNGQRRAIADGIAQLLAKLPPDERRTVRRYRTVPFVALDVTDEQRASLETLGPEIVRIVDDELLFPTIDESVPVIEGDQAWNAGYDGSGRTIAILDTGVDTSHPMFSGKIVAEACFSREEPGVSETFCPNNQSQQIGPGAAAPCPEPDCLHGTHVAGIAAGADPGHNPPRYGVARGATILPVQVFTHVVDAEQCGGTAPCMGAFTSDIIAGLEHVYSLALAGTHPIAAVNMSLGGGLYTSNCDTQPYKPIIDNLRAIGIATVVASGNTGIPFGISTPACISTAISVGSTTKDDVVSSFSNAAPFLSVWAPGEAITSAVPGNGYETFSGTSMATPHVSGAWAVLRQAVPSASVATLLQTLRTTGVSITDGRFFGSTTAPRIRLLRALGAHVPLTHPAPSIASLSPTRVRANSGSLALAVEGSGFDAFSVVEWNGAARPTKSMSTSRLVATIAAADLAAAGTALVRVVNPAPGGGVTPTLPFTIDPPPTLTVNTTAVAPGSPVTLTLAHGLGGGTDYFTLSTVGSANNSYLDWVYVGTGVTSRTWTTNAPAAAGSYEFRLFAGGVRVATSPAFTVDPSLNPVPIAQALSPSSVFAGGTSFTLAVTGTSFTSSSVVRWNGAARTTTFVSANELRAAITAADVASAGSAQITVFTGTPGGGASAPLTFTVRSRPTLTVNQTSVAGGASVTTTLTNGPGGWADWIALAQVGAPLTSYLQYTFVGNGVTSRAWTVAMPSTAGTYEFRLFADNGYTLLATSPAVTVAGGGGGGGGGPAQLLVSSTTAAGGSVVTVTLNDGPGGSTDWIALAATTAANTSYIQYTYVGSGVTTRTWTVAMPVTAGTYEFRLFLNNGYTRAATSPTVTVTEPPPPVLSVSPASAAPGTPVTVTLTNGRGGSSDWIALARAGSGNTSYVQYVYVGAGKSTFTWTVPAPATAGAYEFRLFLNNGYTRAATSPTFTVP